jgi:hypothetical protein
MIGFYQIVKSKYRNILTYNAFKYYVTPYRCNDIEIYTVNTVNIFEKHLKYFY